jgi:hypothetical protein
MDAENSALSSINNSPLKRKRGFAQFNEGEAVIKTMQLQTKNESSRRRNDGIF